jgi:hypothetical protein
MMTSTGRTGGGAGRHAAVATMTSANAAGIHLLMGAALLRHR